MSLNPWFGSTLFGALIGMGGLLSAMAMLNLVLTVCLPLANDIQCVATRENEKKTENSRRAFAGNSAAQQFQRQVVKTRIDLGNLLLAFVMLWGYFAFAHFLIVWSGNLPDEAEWYLQRVRGGWHWLIVVVVATGLFLPFGALLSRKIKLTPRWLMAVCAFVLTSQIVALCWNVFPSFSPGQFAWHPAIAVTLPAGTGLWSGGMLYLLRSGLRDAAPQHQSA